MGCLQGRRALVTGASAGIGAATARELAEHGARVACLARRRERVEALADELDGVAVACDVSDPGAAADGVDTAARELGGLDVLVNNAGVLRLGTISDGDPQDWRAMFDVNVVGLLAATQAAIPHLRAAEQADVVLVSSLSGRRVPRGTATVYAATKHAVHAIGWGLRNELHGDGVRVSVISPGIVDTDIASGQDDERAARFAERVEQVGLAPEVVARAIRSVAAEPPEVNTLEVALLPTAQEV